MVAIMTMADHEDIEDNRDAAFLCEHCWLDLDKVDNYKDNC